MPKYKTAEDKQRAEAIKQAARNIIAMPIGPAEERLQLANQLSDLNLIGYARQVLEKADLDDAAPVIRRKVLRKLGVFTAKDQELPLEARLKTAESILRGLLDSTPQSETEIRQDILGSLGGVRKQRWYAYALVDDLRRSLDYYEQGYQLGVNAGYGSYVAINTAYMRDVLSDNPQPGGGPAAAAPDSPEAIRQQVIDILKPKVPSQSGTERYWTLCTLAEAYLGIGDTENARACTTAAAQVEHHPWETETAVKQLVQLARIRARRRGVDLALLAQSPEWLAVKPLLGDAAIGADSFLRGKVGLALSGGGFRASIYHIGVLAKLAEVDMLRHVEVISSVSGGSIVAAYYYLKLKKLLETKADSNITRQDYIQLVAEMENDFVTGVQKNLRTRMLIGSRSNWKVLWSRLSSTTHRLADLYDRELYDRLGGPKYMHELRIAPAEADGTFYPQYDNWERNAKVPILILNSTTLNSCHNWQFTASFMGEPPARAVDEEIDANDRFRRMYYEEAPEDYKKFPLSYAVAASACVPGLFTPLLLDRLYPDADQDAKYDVELVDGGVYDNQGIASLLEQDCSVLLVSDACGQTGIEEDPATNHLGAMSRSNNILMARVREAQYLLLNSLRDARLLRGLMYIHLKKGLKAAPIDWLGCSDPSPHPDAALKTSYGVRRDIQKAVADIRTDLDSFSDIESDALMYSGYQMTDEEFRHCITGFGTSSTPANWRFLAIGPIASGNSESADVVKVRKSLTVAHNQAGKGWRLLWYSQKALCIVGILVVLALLAMFVNKHHEWFVYDWLRQGEPVTWRYVTAKVVGIVVLAIVLIKLIELALVKLLRYHNSVLQYLGSLLAFGLGWLILAVHLNLFDRYYLRWGPKYRKQRAPAPPAAAARMAAK